MTDLQQFDLLCERAQNAVTVTHKVEFLRQAVKLYKGHVFENACEEHWIISTVTHYKSRYIGIVNELLTTLMAVGDYTEVQKHASRAIELTPENVKAHYWLICSMIKLETFELAKNQIMVARKLLTSDEYTSLKKLIFQDDTIPHNSLFDIE